MMFKLKVELAKETVTQNLVFIVVVLFLVSGIAAIIMMANAANGFKPPIWAAALVFLGLATAAAAAIGDGIPNKRLSAYALAVAAIAAILIFAA